MDEVRFDRFVRRLGRDRASRRRFARGLVGAAAAAVVAALGRQPVAAATCAKNGAVCDPRRPGQCCSGACARTGRHHRCKPTPGAEGCTVRQDICVNDLHACPDKPGGSCVVLDDGLPFCALASGCLACEADADCNAAFRTDGGRCIKQCPVCDIVSGGHACVFPGPLRVTVEEN